MRSGGSVNIHYPPMGDLNVLFEFDHGFYPWSPLLSQNELIRWYIPERDPDDHLGHIAGLVEGQWIEDCNNFQDDFDDY